MEADGNKAATIFLSYSRDDQKRALPVIKALEAAGFQVWWDGLLEGGDNFLPTTEKALETADAVVVLWSKTSVESHWVRDEAQRGRERGCLVPLRIDEAKPPLGFRQFQVINISKWRGKPGAPEMERVIRAVQSLAGTATAAPPALPRQPLLSRRVLIGGGAALLAGGAGIAAWKLGVSPAQAKGNSVAVLPFRNLSGDEEQDYFAEGISEQIRSTLSRNLKLLVMAPTSIAAAVKDGIDDPKALAAKLNVSFLLAGSVRRMGDRLRISATLTDSTTGFPSWSEEFDKQLDDIFAVQDLIADAVARAMAAQTAGDGKIARKGPGGTSNIKAYDAFLRGNAFYALRSGEAAYRSALAQYDAAIHQDSDFAQAHAARALALLVIMNAYGKAEEVAAGRDDALASARRAVELAPELAIAQSTLGYVLVQGKLDIHAAAHPYELARKLGGGDALVQTFSGIFAAEIGQRAEAKAAIEQAIKLDPLNPGAIRIAGFVANCAEDWDGAIGYARRALAINPRIDGAHGIIGDALIRLGRFAEARSEYAQEPETSYQLTGLAVAAHRLGDTAEAKLQTDKLVAEFGDAMVYQQAQIAAQASQKQLAMEKLRLARQLGDSGLAIAFTDPLLQPLRGEPDFYALLKELGFG